MDNYEILLKDSKDGLNDKFSKIFKIHKVNFDKNEKFIEYKKCFY